MAIYKQMIQESTAGDKQKIASKYLLSEFRDEPDSVLVPEMLKHAMWCSESEK